MISNFKAARSLGWISLAVGATEIAATRWLEEQIGVGDHAALIRGFGVREIAAGVTILSDPGLTNTVAGGLWARVVGDVLDLATLSLARHSSRRPSGLATVTGIVLGITGLDLIVATRVQRELHRANVISKRAKARVKSTAALPHVAPDGHADPKGLNTVPA